MNSIQRYWGIFIILVFSFIILSRIFHHGFFAVHDDTQPTRIYEMTKSLKDGLFPVRWVHDLGFGYGYPIFNYYAPFPYYIGALFNIIGFDAITSAKIMFGLAVLVAGIGMYLFIRSFLGELPSVAAGILYLFYPYFAINIFIRGAVGEYYAYAILPFIFWGLYKIYYATAIPWIAISSIALTALIISHNLSAYMLTIILFFFILSVILFKRKNKKRLLTSYLTVLVLSFLLSAFYTIPALFEINFTDVNSQLTGNFNYSNHFVCPIQLWDSPWGFAGSTKGCVDGMSFRLGKTNIIFAVLGIMLGLYVLFTQRKKEHAFLFFFSIFLLFFSLFMMTDYSRPIWEVLPNIEFLQFPWRFLNFSGFALAVLSGFFVFFLRGTILPYFALILIILGALGLNLKLFTPQNYNNRTDVYYTDKEQIVFAVSKITNEYMPQGFVRPINRNQLPKSPLEIVKGEGKITIVENKTGVLQAKVQMRTLGDIRINKAYFPAWNLFVNTKQYPLKKIPQGMMFSLPSGEHMILLRFIQTPIEKFANLLSVAGSLALVAGIIINYLSYAKKTT